MKFSCWLNEQDVLELETNSDFRRCHEWGEGKTRIMRRFPGEKSQQARQDLKSLGTVISNREM